MPNEIFQVDPPHADVELGVAREPFDVVLALPPGGVTDKTGVIVHACEFGKTPGSADIADRLLPELAERHDCAVVSPAYFGIMRNSKVDVSGQFIHNLNRIYNMKFTSESFAAAKSYADVFVMVAQAVAERGVTSVDLRCQPIIVTGRGEYQNWGFLPAIDCLSALGAALDRFPQADTRRIYALGQYYGGYVASLLGKLAPGTFAAIVNRSGYSRVETRHVLCGETLESDLEVNYRIEGQKDYSFTMSLCSNNPWTVFDETSRFYFSDACRAIRSMLAREHFVDTDASFVYFSEDGDADYIRHMDAQVDILGGFAEVRHEKMPSYKAKRVESLGELLAYARERYPDCFSRTDAGTDFSLGSCHSFPCAGKTYTLRYGADPASHVAVEIN